MNLSPVLKQRFFDANGLPLAGGLLYSYAAGTSTPQATYSNSTGTTNTNPVVLDASGYADVWLDPNLSYKFVLKDSGGVTLWTEDAVGFLLGVAKWNTGFTYQQGDIVSDSSGQGLLYVSLIGNNQGNALTNVAAWRVFAGNVRTVSSNQTSPTLLVTDDLVRSNSTAGALTHTLPPCATTPIGKRITVKDVGTGGFTTSVKGSGTDTVDGVNTWSTALRANESATFENTGTTWDVLNFGLTDGSVSAAKLAANAVTTAKILDSNVTTSKLAAGAVTPDKLSAKAYGLSSSSGVFSTTSSTFVTVTNLSLTITTTGRPVVLVLISDGSLNSSFLRAEAAPGASNPTGGGAWFAIYRGATELGRSEVGGQITFSSGGGTDLQVLVPPGSLIAVDNQVAGTYSYSVTAAIATGSTTATVSYCRLLAYEL